MSTKTNTIKWHKSPDGLSADTGRFELHVGKLESGGWCYIVRQYGFENQYRGEAKTQRQAKFVAESLMNKIS